MAQARKVRSRFRGYHPSHLLTGIFIYLRYASQVINITIGLGLPFAIYNLCAGQPTKNENNDTLLVISFFLGLQIAVYLLSFLPFLQKDASCKPAWLCFLDPQCRTFKAVLNKSHARVLFIFFVICYVACIVAAETTTL